MEYDKVTLGQGVNGRGTQSVHINGAEIKYVTELEIHQEVNEPPRVTITFYAVVETLPDVSA